jgi:pimeloyl-ACP methyl ester carboxylesterase
MQQAFGPPVATFSAMNEVRRVMSWLEWVRGGAFTGSAGERVFYRVDGVGPTLLFAHGFPTSSHDWAKVIGQLAHRHRCVSFDFLGFGASDKPRRAYSYALQQEVLARVVAAAEVSRAVLVAHDYAVTLAQDLVAGVRRSPFDLEGVIFLNGALDPSQHRTRPIQRVLATRLGGLVGPMVLGRHAVLSALRAVMVRPEALDDDEVWAAITAVGGLEVMPRLLHYLAERRARRDELVDALRSPRVPLAFAWGMEDPVSGAHVLDAVAPLPAGAAVRHLKGVGHYPQLEAANDVAAFIDETVTTWRARGRPREEVDRS